MSTVASMTSSLLSSSGLSTSGLNSPLIHSLANGLTIIAEQMPLPAINFNLWLRVGSAVEADDINGMAHFLEHMVFKGTHSLGSGEFERAIEGRGAVTNAATSQEYTHYYITTAPHDFELLAPLQLDVVCNASIPDQAFEREKKVVLEEISRSEDNPRRRTYLRAMETCFQDLPYRRPVLGSTAVIEGLIPEQMRSFHQRWYQPAKMTAVAVGNLPTDRLIEIVAESVEQVWHPQAAPCNPSVPTVPAMFPEPTFTTIVRREFSDRQLQQARLVMMWRVPGIQNLEQTYALDVLSTILGQGKLSRLVRDLREERQWVSQISTSHSSYHTQGVFSISAQLPVEHLEAVEAAILEHIRLIQKESIREAELDRIRTQVANRFIFRNERPSDRANLYGYYFSQLGSLEPAFSYCDRIKSLTRDDIQSAAQQYLSIGAYAVVIIKPES